MSDIDFGQLSEALNDKSDRDLRNVDTTAKADAVIDYQEPTAENNYTWYRKYKSGWVEQGGWRQDADTASAITLPVSMSNANYVISPYTIKAGTSSETGNDVTVRLFNQTTTSFGYQLKVVNGNTGQGTRNWCWRVSGMAAS